MGPIFPYLFSSPSAPANTTHPSSSGYANYTSQGWNIRIHGLAYKQPLSNKNIVSNKTIDDAANKFLPNLDISQLQPHEQDNARNLTSAILSLPQEHVQLVFTLDVAEDQGVVSGWSGKLVWPKLTDSRGMVLPRNIM